MVYEANDESQVVAKFFNILKNTPEIESIIFESSNMIDLKCDGTLNTKPYTTRFIL
jgi:hypothetical protein